MLKILESIDQALFLLINTRFGRDWLDPVFVDLSTLGNWTVALIAVAVLAEMGRRLLGRHVLAVVIVSALLWPTFFGIKSLVGRARPTKALQEQVDRGSVTLRLPEKNTPRHNSFPSGHSALAFFLMTYVGMYKRAYRTWALMLAGLIAFSRVYVGAHYPFDCLVGSLMGAGAGWLAWRVFKRLEPNSGNSDIRMT